MLISHQDSNITALVPSTQVARISTASPSPAIPFIVLANRAPFRHEQRPDGSVSAVRSSGGLVTAIEPLVQAHSGTWVAHGDGLDLDAADARGRMEVRSGRSRYLVRYVSCNPDEYRGFYCGFANEALWPLCHAAHVEPAFRMTDFRHYESANRRFAAAVCDEAAGSAPLVFVQDYHFALAPAIIRQHLPAATLVSFWHIPWPHLRTFRTCPWARTLVEGLLGSDIVGLQTDEDCRNFLDAAATLVACDVDNAQAVIRYRGRRIGVRAYPVGVPWNSPTLRKLPPPALCREQLAHDLGLAPGIRVGVGVDRLDYTKGLVGKFAAVERLLEIRPELRGRFTFVQVAEPSRCALPAYRQARDLALATSERVNARFGSDHYRPIVLLERHFDIPEVYRMYRAADLCYVNSLDDGMNLVAKEFVSAREDEHGVLLLSEFAGASHQLTSALMVNPYAADQSARTLALALEMPADEQARRMREMREVVAASDSTWWAGQLVRDALASRRPLQKGRTGDALSAVREARVG